MASSKQINDGVRMRLKERVQKFGIRRLARLVGKSPATIGGKLRGWVGMDHEEMLAWEKAMNKNR